jgi:hypothetical protein
MAHLSGGVRALIAGGNGPFGVWVQPFARAAIGQEQPFVTNRNQLEAAIRRGQLWYIADTAHTQKWPVRSREGKHF